MTKPNFFLIGAAKCGTTSMHAYLQQHPDIFMSDPKEPHFFSDDVITRRPRSMGEIKDRKRYMQLFRGRSEAVIGEASVWYLYSQVAAERLYEFNPDAKLMCILRHPVEMVWSMYRFNLQRGMETETQFDAAFDLIPARKRGRHIPFACNRRHVLFYDEIARYGEQMERYLRYWPRDRIHIILFEKFKTQLPRTYADALAFLGVDTNFTPDFRILNKTITPRNIRASGYRTLFPGLYQSVYARTPKAGRHLLKIITGVKANNQLPSADIPPSVAVQLNNLYHDDMVRFQSVTGLDLNDWLTRHVHVS